MGKQSLRFLFFISVIFFCVHSFAAERKIATAIDSLLNNNDTQAAYLLAKQNSEQHVGEVAFDLAYARAAVAVDAPLEALLALQRVLIVEPRNVNAQAQLAFVYYKLGKIDDMLQQIAYLKLNYPSLATDKLTTDLLVLVKQAGAQQWPAGKKLHNQFYVTVGGGYDDNINSNTDENFLQLMDAAAIPVVTPALISQVISTYYSNYDDISKMQVATEIYNLYADVKELVASMLRSLNDQRIASPLYLGKAGFFGDYLVTDNFMWTWRGDVDYDSFTKSHDSDITQGNIAFGGIYNWAHIDWAALLSLQEYMIGWQSYRQSPILSLSAARMLGERNSLKLFGDFGHLAYDDDKSLNTNAYIAGLEWSLLVTKNNLFTLQTYYGDYTALDKDMEYNASDFYAAKALVLHKITSNQDVFASVLAQDFLYDAKQLDVLARRRDLLLRYDVGWSWQFKPSWLAAALVSYYHNHSNIVVYKYNKTCGEVSLTYFFN